jgi:intraflagellar transport protein 122
VWTLQWNTTQHKTSDALAVGCWDGTLSIYDLAGKQVGNDKELGFDPCCVTYHDAMYLCVGGSDKKVLLYSRDGVKLMTMCEAGDWIWTVRSRPKHDYVVVGCNDGSISMLQLIFSTIRCMGYTRSTMPFERQ